MPLVRKRKLNSLCLCRGWSAWCWSVLIVSMCTAAQLTLLRWLEGRLQRPGAPSWTHCINCWVNTVYTDVDKFYTPAASADILSNPPFFIVSSCTDPGKQEKLCSVFRLSRLADKQTGATGSFFRYSSLNFSKTWRTCVRLVRTTIWSKRKRNGFDA